MPTVKISIPDEEFIDLKDKATYFTKLDYKDLFTYFPDLLRNYTSELLKINFNEAFPEYKFNEVLPELQVGEDGFAKYDVEQVVNGFDYDPEHYDEGNPEKFLKHFLSSNKDFNLVDIIDTLKGMKIADIDDKEKIESLFEDIYKFFENPFEQDDDEPEELKFDDIVIKATIQIKFFLKLFRKINFKKFFPNSDYKIILPELQIDDNGYANFNIDEVFSGFNFDHEFYKENYPEIYNSNELMEIILYSNENFKIFDILDKIDELMMINNINEKVFLNDLGNLLTSTMITGDSYREEMGKTEENQAFFDGSLTEFKTKNATMTFELNR